MRKTLLLLAVLIYTINS